MGSLSADSTLALEPRSREKFGLSKTQSMESRLRHDLRHPLATISMIASALAEFGDTVDDQQVTRYHTQVKVELESLHSLVEENKVELSFSELEQRIGDFLASPGSADAASALDEACRTVMQQLTDMR